MRTSVPALLIFAVSVVLAVPAGAAGTAVEQLEHALHDEISETQDPPFRFRVSCPDDARVGRKGRIVSCVANPRPDNQDAQSVPVLILDRRHGYAYDIGSGIYRSGREIREAYGRGRYCRDLAEADEPYFYAVMYWFAVDRPDRMDADGNGIPCETVYSQRDVADIWSDRLRF